MLSTAFSQKTMRETNLEYLKRHVAHKGAACLIWPFSCDLQGYGQVAVKRRVTRASRVMCALVHGPAPSPRHHAAHSCGRGQDGCFNPDHVSWKTPTENQQDSVQHGTAKKPGGPRRKLTDAQVAEIRALKGTKTQRELGKLFGVCWETIGQIQRGRERPDRPRRHGYYIPEDQRESYVRRAKMLRASGVSHYHIGEALGVSKTTAKTLTQG